MPTAPAPARTGTASMPVPMNPKANSEEAKCPAAGLSASAAWAAPWMSRLPERPSVEAVVRMMATSRGSSSLSR